MGQKGHESFEGRTVSFQLWVPRHQESKGGVSLVCLYQKLMFRIVSPETSLVAGTVPRPLPRKAMSKSPKPANMTLFENGLFADVTK